MANQYLVDVHQFINAKIESARKAKCRAEQRGDLSQTSYYEGQLKELSGLRRFLKDNFDLITQSYY